MVVCRLAYLCRRQIGKTLEVQVHAYGSLHTLICYIILVLCMHLAMALCTLLWLQLLINNNGGVFIKKIELSLFYQDIVEVLLV